MHVGALRGVDHRAGVGLAEARDVLGHAAGKEIDLLRQGADIAAEILSRPGKTIGAVEPYVAGAWSPHAHDQSRERRFAGRARTDDAEGVARIECERGAADDWPILALYAENHALYGEPTFGRRQRRAASHLV